MEEVSLSLEFKETEDQGSDLAYGLCGEVISATGIPQEIFVMHRAPKLIATGMPWDMEIIDSFQNVATPVDIEDTVDESLANENTRHYRSKSFELLFRNEDDRDRAKNAIDEDVKRLVESWKRMYNPEAYSKKEVKEY